MTMILGVLLGAAASWLITHLYYARSTKELRREVENLREKLASLDVANQGLRDAADAILDAAEMTRRHVVAGTPDDPEFPYK